MFMKQEETGLLGLDIGSTSVKLVEYSRNGHLELENLALAVVEDASDRDSYVRAIASVLQASEVITKTVAGSVSGPKVAVRGFQFPKLSPSEIDGAVRYEGSQVMALDIDDSVIDYSVLPSPDEKRQTTDVLFVAASKDEVSFRTDLMENAELEPRLMTVDALALLDALLTREDLPDTVAVAHIGARNASVGVTRPGGTPFVRDIEVAGNAYTQAVAEALGISFREGEEAKVVDLDQLPDAMQAAERVTRKLVRELSRSLTYYQTRENGSDVDTLYLCGGASRMRGLAERISDDIGIKVERWSPLDLVRVDDSKFDQAAVAELAPFAALAAALALKKEVH